MLVERGHGERETKGRGFVMGQLALSKGLARMGIRYNGQRADIPSKGIFHTIDLHALIITMTYCMCVLIKKRFHCAG
jgi:hypothetical protein